jgi:hypothetical protein
MLNERPIVTPPDAEIEARHHKCQTSALVQANPRTGGADIITRAPHALFCQLRHLARAAAAPNAGQSASEAVRKSARTPPVQKRLRTCQAGNSLPDKQQIDTSRHNVASSGPEDLSAAHVGGGAPAAQPAANEAACLMSTRQAATISLAPNDAGSSPQPVLVTITSEYGVQASRTYTSAEDVACSIVAAMEDAPLALRAPFKEFRAGPKAVVLLLTWRRWQAQRATGEGPTLAINRSRRRGSGGQREFKQDLLFLLI